MAIRPFHPIVRSSRVAYLETFLATLLSLLFLTAPPAPAQSRASGTIEGTVVTESGDPVSGAAVEILDLRRRTLTDDDGTFLFTDIAVGPHRVRVESLGAGASLETVTVSSGETVRTQLVVGLIEHGEELVVSGLAGSRSQFELAQATTVLDAEELMQRRQATLGETLDRQAGIASTGFGSGASRPIIRGLGGDRIRMLQDGLGAGDVSGTSPDHAVSVDPLAAERIEVLRGPATLLYGSSAIGGVVNVLDDRAPTFRTDSFGGEILLEGSSVDDGRSASVRLGGGSGDWAWHLDGNRREADDYEIPGAAEVDPEPGEEITETLESSDLEVTSFGAGVTRFVGDDMNFSLSVSGFETDYGIPGGGHHHGEEEHGDEDHDDEHGDDDHDDDDHEGEDDDHDHEGEEEEEGEEVRIDLERQRIDFAGEVRRGFGPFAASKIRLAYVDYEHVELEGEELEVGTTFTNEHLEGRLEFVQAARDGWTGSVGIQVETEDFSAVGEEAFVPPSESNAQSIFTYQELERGALRWQLGARFESAKVDPDNGASRSFDGLSASAGLVWSLPADGWSIATSLSRSTRAPAAEELFADGPHIATQTFEIGDPDLELETSLGLEVALRRTEGRLTGGLSVYSNQFDDFIFQRFTGEEEDELPVVLVTQADAEFTGVELELRLEAWRQADRHLDFEVVGDLVRGELDAGGDLPRVPPRRLGLGAHYHHGDWHLFGEVRVVDDQDDVAANETPTDGYTMVNASVSHRLMIGKQVLDLMLRGRNLGDVEARNHVSYLKDDILLPGRDVSFTLRWIF